MKITVWVRIKLQEWQVLPQESKRVKYKQGEVTFYKAVW